VIQNIPVIIHVEQSLMLLKIKKRIKKITNLKRIKKNHKNVRKNVF